MKPRYHQATAFEAPDIDIANDNAGHNLRPILQDQRLLCENRWKRSRDVLYFIANKSSYDVEPLTILHWWLTAKSRAEYQRSLVRDVDSFTTFRNHVSSECIIAEERAQFLLYNLQSRIKTKAHLLRQCQHRLASRAVCQAPGISVAALEAQWNEMHANLEYVSQWVDRMVLRRETDLQTKLANTQLRESRIAIEQGVIVSRLTRMAFLVIPISCISAIFGMNVRELDPAPSIWVFVAIAMGVTVVTVVAAYLGTTRRLFVAAWEWLWTHRHARAWMPKRTTLPLPPRAPSPPPIYW